MDFFVVGFVQRMETKISKANNKREREREEKGDRALKGRGVKSKVKLNYCNYAIPAILQTCNIKGTHCTKNNV